MLSSAGVRVRGAALAAQSRDCRSCVQCEVWHGQTAPRRSVYGPRGGWAGRIASSAMVTERASGSQRAEELAPIMVPVALNAEAVVLTLLRWASQTTGRWSAHRIDAAPAGVLDRQDGPLGTLRLRLSARTEGDEPDYAAVWITGQFAVKPARLHGVLERRRAEHQAPACREEVLAVLRAPAAADTPPPLRKRRNERRQVMAAARLYVGTRMWRAEVLQRESRRALSLGRGGVHGGRAGPAAFSAGRRRGCGRGVSPARV